MSTINRENFFDDIYFEINRVKPEIQKITVTAPKGLWAEYSNKCLGITISKEKIKVPMPKKYIINKGATVLIWDDGEKTVVKRCADDEFNKRLGFLTAFFQHYSGMSKNKANKFLAELEVEDEETQEQEIIKIKSCDDDLKVGDKVKIRKDLCAYERYGTQTFVDSMNKYKGEIVTIEGVNYGGYEIKEDNGIWCWTKEMFEKRPKHMKGEK